MVGPELPLTKVRPQDEKDVTESYAGCVRLEAVYFVVLACGHQTKFSKNGGEGGRGGSGCIYCIQDRCKKTYPRSNTQSTSPTALSTMNLFQGAQNFKINGATFIDQRGVGNTTSLGVYATAGIGIASEDGRGPLENSKHMKIQTPPTGNGTSPQTSAGIRGIFPQASRLLPIVANRIANINGDGGAQKQQERNGSGSSDLLGNLLRIIRG